MLGAMNVHSQLNNRFQKGLANIFIFVVVRCHSCNIHNIILDSANSLFQRGKNNNQMISLSIRLESSRSTRTDSAICSNCLRILEPRGSSYLRLCGRRSNSSSSIENQIMNESAPAPSRNVIFLGRRIRSVSSWSSIVPLYLRLRPPPPPPPR